MVLDMESEFYKLAKDILSKPKNLYKMTTLGPKSARVTVMGADGFVMVGKSVLESFTRGPGSKAYKIGMKCGTEMFSSLIKEFDEEIERLHPGKLMELGTYLSSTLGWGDIEVTEMDLKKGRMMIKAGRTIEQRYKKAKHHQLTCGFLTGITSTGMKRKMEGKVEGEEDGSILFSFQEI